MKLNHGSTRSSSSHDRKVAGKEKGKMSLVDIEEMLYENGGEWDVHAMTRNEAEFNSKDLMAALRVSDEQAEYDSAVNKQAERATREHFLRVPPPGGHPTWPPLEPPSDAAQPAAPSPLRATRRSARAVPVLTKQRCRN